MPPDVDLVLLIEPSVARDIRRRRVDEGPAKTIVDAVQAAGLTLAPLHPELPGAALPPDLLSAFVVTAPAGPELDELAARLRALPGAEAAYVKPRDEPP